MQLPAFIKNSGILELPPSFPWKGDGMHFGPSQGTKLNDDLQKLTVSGLTAVAVVVEKWLLSRLKVSANIEPFSSYLDAVIAWTADWRYKNESALDSLIPPKDSAAHQALRDGIWSLHLMVDDIYWRSPRTADHCVTAMVGVVKQTLPTKQKKAFTDWLNWATQRAIELAPRPAGTRPLRKNFADDEAYHLAGRPYVGVPLPPEALDPEAGYKPEQREQLFSKFLSDLDVKKNPFLRSPDDMKKLGFTGTPYKL
jgi:hypothetical protein